VRNACPRRPDRTAPRGKTMRRDNSSLPLSDGSRWQRVHPRLDLTAEDHSRGGVEVIEGAVSAATARFELKYAEEPLECSTPTSARGHVDRSAERRDPREARPRRSQDVRTKTGHRQMRPLSHRRPYASLI
jgi:hypothetical protein